MPPSTKGVRGCIRGRVLLKGGGDVVAFSQEVVGRTRRLEAQLALLATNWVYDQMRERLPISPMTATYRNSLSVARVFGAGQDGVYAVFVDMKKRKVRKIDVSRTLLYVKAIRRGRRVPPEIDVLEKYNPWTTDTLPFKPNRRFAIVISRKALRGVVTKTALKRIKERPKWKLELQKVGARRLSPAADKIPRNLTALPDVALDAIRLEFGLGREKAVPHWRPAILGLRSVGLRQILRQHRELMYALTRPRFRLWRKWPTRIRRRISINEAKRFAAFQRKLGLRIR